MQMYQAIISGQSADRIRRLHPDSWLYPVVEFAADTSHDAWSFALDHLRHRFPKASITTFDFSLSAL